MSFSICQSMEVSSTVEHFDHLLSGQKKACTKIKPVVYMALVLLCVALCGNRHISSLAVGLLAVRSGYNFCPFVKADVRWEAATM